MRAAFNLWLVLILIPVCAIAQVDSAATNTVNHKRLRIAFISGTTGYTSTLFVTSS